jgi:polyisoprenoid-binding protein YceI
MHGVTKEITIPMTLSGPVTDPWGNVKIGLEGSAKVDRKDYGLVWNKTLDGGGVVVGDDVTLTISIEAGKAN